VGDHTNQVIILSGGEPLASTDNVALPLGARVIAADSGLHHAAELDLDVDLVIGDMDSVDAGRLAAAVDRGVEARTFPSDKDRTDLELAVDVALGWGATDFTFVGAHTGRLDHFLGAMAMFAALAERVERLVWIDGSTWITACAPQRAVSIVARPGDTVSLIPVGEGVTGVTATGLRWPLHGDAIPAGSTRGISNVCVAPPVRLSVDRGTILVVHERTRP
jgi:thiamine pyrophosphokinase